MWVILKVKATRYPCYSADNFLHSDRRWSEGELSTSVGGKTQCTAFRLCTKGSQGMVLWIIRLDLIKLDGLGL